MKPSEVKEKLREIGVRPSRRLGQHFLLDEELARRMVAGAGIHPAETVLEVGPGLGTLTEELLATGGRILAVEKDHRLCEYLRRSYQDLDLIEGDVLKVDLPPFDRVVSNLPYEISSPLTFFLLAKDFKRAVLTYQLEFAERLVAAKGSRHYSRLSVNAYYRCAARIMEVLPPSTFWPPPEVDSAVVRMDKKAPPFEVDPDAFRRVTDALFSHRRKKVVNALTSEWESFAPSEGDLKEVVETTRFASRRPQDMSPEEIAELANALTPKVKGQRSNLKSSRVSDGTKEDAL